MVMFGMCMPRRPFLLMQGGEEHLGANGESNNNHTGDAEKQVIPLPAPDQTRMKLLTRLVGAKPVSGNARLASIFFHNHGGEPFRKIFDKPFMTILHVGTLALNGNLVS